LIAFFAVVAVVIVITEIAVAKEDEEWQREREVRQYKDRIIKTRRQQMKSGNKNDNGIF